MKRIKLCSGDGVCIVEVPDTVIKRLEDLTDFWLAVDDNGEFWFYYDKPYIDLDIYCWLPSVTCQPHRAYLEDVDLPSGVNWEHTLTFVPCIEDIIVE